MKLSINPELKRLSPTNFWHILATGFGSGLSPKAPGTAGSLAAVPFCYLLGLASLPLKATIIVVAFAIGVYACQKATDAIGIDDHGGIVWDEFVGMFITVACLPNTLAWLIAGFVVFRIFDIWKPWPIGPIDAKLKGGLGIMLDDVIAGVFALVVLKLIEVTFF
ncbi:MAG: phosphatidylglycerophosphatase A [Aeromonadaceae bacterium]|nr:phosphatidylglycerophosphatase A [Aeromonadaceae bacterium]MBP8065186.1 phosphatidylglycerophosphatase A [Aeromonadaceae bacterium]MBP9569095.1 phosphatidylglycerophosphatase A [Aeromonadaceae bacterium]